MHVCMYVYVYDMVCTGEMEGVSPGAAYGCVWLHVRHGCLDGLSPGDFTLHISLSLTHTHTYMYIYTYIHTHVYI